MNFKIREATESDIPRIWELIMELALFEKGEDQVINTQEQMLKDGFGETPLFKTIVAELNGVVEGASLYYYRYSTWKGKRLYLEDLIVSEKFRGEGLGKGLFERTVEIAKENNCSGMMWQVLDWNDSAIKFYDNYGTVFDDNWVNCKLNF